MISIAVGQTKARTRLPFTYATPLSLGPGFAPDRTTTTTTSGGTCEDNLEGISAILCENSSDLFLDTKPRTLSVALIHSSLSLHDSRYEEYASIGAETSDEKVH